MHQSGRVVFLAGCAAPRSASITGSAGPYLGAYASEMAWREDNRRVSNGEQFNISPRSPSRIPVSRSGALLAAER